MTNNYNSDSDEDVFLRICNSRKQETKRRERLRAEQQRRAFYMWLDRAATVAVTLVAVYAISVLF